ncbi:Transforming acidic coiled-coil-containing protein 2 [Dictyocoela roeselum]|nr:Transforming acidic coiled-coil-containing protein 2 [Dictyocoela roeselum]
MDTSRKIKNKIKKYISSSLSSISYLISRGNKNEIYTDSDDLEKQMSPHCRVSKNRAVRNHSDEVGPDNVELLYTTPPNECDWSLNNMSDSFSNGNSFSNIASGSIVLPKEEYDEMQSQIYSLQEEISINKQKEDEYKKLLIDFDSTMSSLMTKKPQNGLLENVIMEKNKKIELLTDELDRYKINEDKLRNHLSILEKDLLRAEERANAYKILAKEKIDSVNKENENIFKMYESERENVEFLKFQVDELFKKLTDKTQETDEVVKYCRDLLNHIETE